MPSILHHDSTYNKIFFAVDPETGKKIRGQKCEVKDYDQFVFDIYSKYIPQVTQIVVIFIKCV